MCLCVSFAMYRAILREPVSCVFVFVVCVVVVCVCVCCSWLMWLCVAFVAYCAMLYGTRCACCCVFV